MKSLLRSDDPAAEQRALQLQFAGGFLFYTIIYNPRSNFLNSSEPMQSSKNRPTLERFLASNTINYFFARGLA